MNIFETTRLPMAAYLHCTKTLEFTGVRKANDATVVFEFLDPEDKGDGIELDFEQGCAVVDARSFAGSERFLKTKMYQALRKEGR